MNEISEQDRFALLEQFGSFPIAYSVAFQPDLKRFGDRDGFLSYVMVGRTAFALADPIAPPEHREALLDGFMAAFKDVGFWQASHKTAETMSRRGFFINAFGSETVVALETFGFGGPERRSFRTAENRFARSGHFLEESSLALLDPAELRRVSDGWRTSKVTKSRELRFLVRPVVLSDEPGARKFLLKDRNGRLEGFAFFDPVYEDGKTVGYLAATRRWLPSTDPLAGYLLMRKAIETFKAEGVRDLHLGLSPFHAIEDKEFNKNWVTRRTFRFIYENRLLNRFVYPVKSLSRHKAIYGGFERQTYYAFNTLPALPRLAKLARACRII